MDLGTVIGLIAGFSIITFGIINGDGNPANFINWNSVLIVLGGTIAATLVNYPLKVFLGVGSILKNAFTKGSYDYIETIEEIVEKAEKARKNGLLSLEGDLTTVNTNRNSCGKWSIFVEKDGGLYSPGHQTYLTCSNDSFVATFASNNRIDGQITGSATQVGDDQRISTAAAPSTYGNGKIGLRCDNTGQFFRAQGSRLPVYSMHNEIGGWEVFEKEDYQP